MFEIFIVCSDNCCMPLTTHVMIAEQKCTQQHSIVHKLKPHCLISLHMVNSSKTLGGIRMQALDAGIYTNTLLRYPLHMRV